MKTQDIFDFITNAIDDCQNMERAKARALAHVGFAFAEHMDTTALVPRYFLDVTNADGDIVLTSGGKRICSDHGLTLTEIAGEIESQREMVRQVAAEAWEMRAP